MHSAMRARSALPLVPMALALALTLALTLAQMAAAILAPSWPRDTLYGPLPEQLHAAARFRGGGLDASARGLDAASSLPSLWGGDAIAARASRDDGLVQGENMEGHNVYPPVGGSCHASHMEVYGFFFQARLKRKLYTPGEGFPPGKTGWEDLGLQTYVQAAIAAHPAPPGSKQVLVDVVVPDASFRVVTRSAQAEHWLTPGWNDLALASVDVPLALPLPGGALAVVAREANGGRLALRERAADGTWAPSWGLLGGGPEARMPAGVATPDGTIFLIGLTPDGSLLLRKRDAGASYFSRWTPLDVSARARETPAVTTFGRSGFALAFRALDGTTVACRYYSLSHRFVASFLGDRASTPPAVTTHAEHEIHVFTTDAHTRLVKRSWHTTSGWGQWSRFGGDDRVVYRPTAFARGTAIDVFIVNSTSVIKHYFS